MKPALLVLLLFVGCATPPSFDRAAFLQRPERRLATYHATFDPDIANRVQQAPAEVLQYLNKMDATGQYSSYQVSSDDLKLFTEYFSMLPQKYQSIMRQSVVGVYFISHFAGGGMSDFLYDAQGKMYIALYLNPEVLHQSLAEWIAYRENSSFNADKSLEIEVTTEGDYRGLLHTLTHEASHIYDYYDHATPYIDPFFQQESSSRETPFTRGVWDDYRVPKPAFDLLKATHYSAYGLYGKIDKAKAVSLYSQLGHTPFSSLYGSLSWAEDFAETFTWYDLQTQYGVGYKVFVKKDGKTVAEFEPAKSAQVQARYPQMARIVE